MTEFKQFGSDNWVAVFPKWHEIIGKMYAGLNWHAPERDLLEFMREEIVKMVEVIDSRLQELRDRPE
mgnify:FL=1